MLLVISLSISLLGIYSKEIIMADYKDNYSTKISITKLRETGDNLNVLK